MKRLIKVIMTGILLLLTLGLAAGLILHEERPEGTSGLEAEALADSMLKALNYQAYQKNVEVVSWTFKGVHHYKWDRKKNEVMVSWDSYRVTFNTTTMDGRALKDGVVLKGEERQKAIQKAWKYFANDSFWLVAPYKIRDPGTKRKLVNTEQGPALLVTYTSGGVTPGDSYLWHLDGNHFPTSWKMWVKIIPIGGLEFSWEGWESKKGAKFATRHKGPASYELEITNLHVE